MINQETIGNNSLIRIKFRVSLKICKTPELSLLSLIVVVGVYKRRCVCVRIQTTARFSLLASLIFLSATKAYFRKTSNSLRAWSHLLKEHSFFSTLDMGSANQSTSILTFLYWGSLLHLQVIQSMVTEEKYWWLKVSLSLNCHRSPSTLLSKTSRMVGSGKHQWVILHLDVMNFTWCLM